MIIGAAVAVLVLAGFLIGRLQSDEPAASAASSAGPAPSVPAEPSPSPTPSSAPPPPPGAIDAYQPVQAETADAATGVGMQDTGDEGGGQNAGWISDGDSLRFDDVNFGDTPPTELNVRLAAEVRDGGGRLEIRLDSPTAGPSATLNTRDTGGWQKWRTEAGTGMAPVTGVHTVFVRPRAGTAPATSSTSIGSSSAA